MTKFIRAISEMSKTYVKAGYQSADDPMEFILSTPEVDRTGDVVEQNWNLKDFRKNPIALYQHNSDEPIGTWSSVRMVAGNLQGRLNLAKAGTSALIDTVRSLVEQGILKAVSVGMMVDDWEPLDKDAPWGGSLLKNPSLHEASLVSVPANASAVAVAKSFHLSDQDMTRLFAPPVETDPLQDAKNRLRLINAKNRARQHT